MSTKPKIIDFNISLIDQLLSKIKHQQPQSSPSRPSSRPTPRKGACPYLQKFKSSESSGQAALKLLQGNKSQQMSQKFIFSGEKTAKKVTLFQEQRPKKFTRKRSERDRSIDSKRSRQDSLGPQYIKQSGEPLSIRLGQIHDEAINFVESFNNSLVLDLNDKKSRQTMYTRTNTNRERNREENALTIRIEMLETQNRVRDSECERLRLQLEEERQKRRKSDHERRCLIREIQELQRGNEKLAVENKKLLKEKQYLLKQVEFLEKINYDDKTRSLQSFREHHMAQELQALREQLRACRTSAENELLEQLKRLTHERDSALERSKAMKSHVEVLRGKNERLQLELLEVREKAREDILGSKEYLQIKERYRRFIETYKDVRAENWNLRNLLEGKEADLVLSDDSDPQREE